MKASPVTHYHLPKPLKPIWVDKGKEIFLYKHEIKTTQTTKVSLSLKSQRDFITIFLYKHKIKTTPNHQSQSRLIKPKKFHQSYPNHQSQTRLIRAKKFHNIIFIQISNQNYSNHQSQSGLIKPKKLPKRVLIHTVSVARYKKKKKPVYKVFMNFVLTQN